MKKPFSCKATEFGVNKNDLSNYLNYTPSELIDKIIDDAINLDVSPDPGWKRLEFN